MSISFCEKYKPKKSNEIIGDYRSTVEITKWLRNFPKSHERCLLITGNHGTGKTCRVDTILKELNFVKKQFNVMKFKKSVSAEMYIRELASCSSIVSLITSEQMYKCSIVIDELDTELLSQEKNQLIDLMKINNKFAICPVIFVFNNKHSKLINTIRKGAHEIRIEIPSHDEMMILLKSICCSEKIRISNVSVANKIIEFSQNDFRRLCSTLHDLVCDVGDKPLSMDAIEKYKSSMMEKDMSIDLFKATSSLLTNFKTIDDCFRTYEIEKVNVPLMIHQNYLLTIDGGQNDYSYLTKLTQSLSDGDVIDNYVYGEQRWDITNVHGFYSCCLPSFILQHKKLCSYPKFFVDMGRTSNKKLNKKHIINASKTFNSIDPFDYVYINKIFVDLITKNMMQELVNIMKTYKLTIDKVDDILKIDKNIQHKIILTTKQKKNIMKLLNL